MNEITQDDLDDIASEMEAVRVGIGSIAKIIEDWYSLADFPVKSSFRPEDSESVYRNDLCYKMIATCCTQMSVTLSVISERANTVGQVVNMLTPEPMPLKPNSKMLERSFKNWVSFAQKKYGGRNDAGTRPSGSTSSETDGGGEMDR